MIRLRFFLHLLVLTLALFPVTAQASPPWEPSTALESAPAAPPTSRILVQYRRPLSRPESTGRVLSAAEVQGLSHRAGVALTYERSLGENWHVLRLPSPLSAEQTDELVHSLLDDPAVTAAEPDILLTTQLVPNDPYFYSQWNLTAPFGMNASTAWDMTTGSPSVPVAVIDTGSLPHQDLTGRLLPGYDFVSPDLDRDSQRGWDSDPSDPGTYGDGIYCSSSLPSSWHGIHVAGIFGASTNNNTGISGISWQNPILPVRALGICGTGYLSDIIAAMRWAGGLDVSGVSINPHPARVINLSLGGAGTCPIAFQSAIDELLARGVFTVAAAGNSSTDVAAFTPAGCQNIFTVAATDSYGYLASYSNYGNGVEISAPGSSILSLGNMGTTSPGGDSYSYKSGTSMATPHVSGAVALMLAVNPELTYNRILQIFQKRSTPFPTGSACANSRICGSGILNAGAAVDEAFQLYYLKIPNEFEPAYAGTAASLNAFLVRTYPVSATPEPVFTVSVGGQAATINRTTYRGTYWELEVTPPAWPNGLYDIQVTINGIPYSHEKAVLYGPQTFLPVISR
ncbi:subtilisin-like serine proteases [Anaerolinea thermolimosa]|uniref:S8 family peptidase n=1 Tax=Anaerolinea thermolimosa TaxID=229919 RepID=UPI0007866389|nr:S8 family peptidase [Anaerolinea thermolimosa]GAP05472.1 subtilisin-like serine proteases [Anaerolinea thermolimosa]